MPEYTFLNEQTGERFDLFYHMAEVPTIGEEIIHNGQVLRRVASSRFHGKTGALGHLDIYPYVSNSLPTTVQGCKMVRERRKDGKLSRPKPLIRSERHEREVMARNNLVKD